jgi:hypothetical protein
MQDKNTKTGGLDGGKGQKFNVKIGKCLQPSGMHGHDGKIGQ